MKAIIGADITAGGDEEAMIDFYLNAGYEDVLLKTHCKVRRATISLTAAEQEYSLPTAALAIEQVYNTASGTTYTMERRTLQDMSDFRAASTAAGPARYYVTRGDYLEVYPAPSSGEVLDVYYVPRPTALSQTTDAPTDIPAEYHELLEWYALSRMAEFKQHEPSKFGLHWRALYDKGLSEMRSGLRQRGGRPARFRFGRRPARVVSNPSQIQW